MLTALDETLFHQGPLTFEQVGTSDHRFYDRQLMGAFRPDGEVGFLSGITLFKNMNVIEGFVIAQSHLKKQYNVRFTKQLRPLPVDPKAQVGGLRLEVIEAFEELRLMLEKGDYPLALDMAFRKVVPPRLEAPHFGRLDGRVHSDYLRYHQIGRADGWIEVDGEHFDASSWYSWRDHSWGVRPWNGGFEPMTGTKVEGGVASASRTGGKGLFLIYLGFASAAHAGGIQIIEDGEGKRLYTDGEAREIGGEKLDVLSARHEILFKPGTRVFETAKVEIDLSSGETWTLDACSVGRPWAARGGGFDGGFADGKGMGVWRSRELLVETDVYDISDPELVILPDGSAVRPKHREQLAVCSINGVAGSAYAPMFVIGPQPRFGLPDR